MHARLLFQLLCWEFTVIVTKPVSQARNLCATRQASLATWKFLASNNNENVNTSNPARRRDNKTVCRIKMKLIVL